MISIEEKIISFTETIRPYLKREGGEYDFVRFEDGTVYIKLLSTCSTCSTSNNTLKQLEDMMVEEIPGVIAVEVI